VSPASRGSPSAPLARRAPARPPPCWLVSTQVSVVRVGAGRTTLLRVTQPEPDQPTHPLDVVGMGSPLVDILSTVDDDTIARLGIARGSMELVDLRRAEEVYADMGPTVEVSGGSAANTMAGVAALGGSAGFVGKVADDVLGQVFTHDIRSAGVEFHPVVDNGVSEGPEARGTGRCLVLVSGDAERTMATHLGVATAIAPADVPVDLVARASVLYLEGYLWDLPAAKNAMRRAIEVAHAHDGSVALSLSDPFCVDRHRRELLDLLMGDVDVLFGNEEEMRRLFSSTSLDEALDAAEETGLLVVTTLGAKGSVVMTARGPVEIPAAAIGKVVDTTGAGDLFAAGFLYGLTHGAAPDACARLGSVCAGEVIGHLGARPQGDLAELARAEGLL
jgi:sugar/nucleoside kinase (ribokinase family)